ncbi:MAG TPA: hypothetical protein VK897_04830 [Anaerolineales bacterium]|nr:hypothetical protein [Anaerolineales bacterium]
MLSRLSRGLTYLLAVLYAIVGLPLFFLPEQLAPVFAWKVTPFMAMTIGGWCLGNAYLAYVSARRWSWDLVSTSLLYLWLFGIFEVVILIIFRDKLVLSHFVAWVYVLALVVNVITAVVGIWDWLRLRPAIRASGPAVPGIIRILPLGAVVFTGSIGVAALVNPLGFWGTNGEIFPEPMSLFTLRSFGAFYLSLAMAVVPLLRYRSFSLFLNHIFSTLGFFITITAAAFAYIRLFDFIGRPFGLLYMVAYVLVGIAVGIVLLKYGTGIHKQQPSTVNA